MAFFTTNSGWFLELTCAGYLVVVFITNRGLIAAPRYRLLYGRTRDCRARIELVKKTSTLPGVQNAADAILTRLDDLDKTDTVVWRMPRSGGVISIPLSKLAAGWRVLHEAELQLLRLESDEEVATRAISTAIRLRGAGNSCIDKLAQELISVDAPPERRRQLLCALLDHLHRQEDDAAERDYEQQRVALWLAVVGLFGLFVIGLNLQHNSTLLMGALGGFLAPVVGAMRSEQRSSWGVMVLSPVGGALAAIGGLLLVRMLSDPELSILGQVFLENSWESPEKPIALALALLFGFSGTLFSRIAIAASSQLAIPRQPGHVGPDTGALGS